VAAEALGAGPVVAGADVAPVEVAGAEEEAVAPEVAAAVVLVPAFGVELELEQAAAVRARTPSTAPVTDLRSIGTSPNMSAFGADDRKRRELFFATQGWWPPW
jgi:hypothetical protein